MKLNNLKVCLAILIVAGISACTKSEGTEGPGAGPYVLELREGFLTTKTGHNVGNVGDTAIVRVYTSSYQVSSTYLAGTLENPVHYWYLENAGGNLRYIRSRQHGHYLGYKTYESAPAGHYPWATNWITLDKTPGDKNRFLIIKEDENFYIQSADNPDLYLNTTVVSQISYTGPQTPQSLFFLPTKQEFFFLKPF